MPEQVSGNSAVQAELWTTRARDWADVMEGWNGWGVPLYRHVLEKVEVSSDTAVLDVGCGAGRFCRIVADRGGAVHGFDATEALIDIARERVSGGDFRTGDMQQLPWPDASFDVVTGFNSFFIAADMAAALAEAHRVARTGGWFAMSVFGRPDRCDSTQLFQAVGALMPPSPGGPSGPSGPGLHEEGVLEDLVSTAGFTTEHAGYLQFEERYPDIETLLRGMTAAPPMVRAGWAVGDDAVREALADAAREFANERGAVTLHEEARMLIARA